MPHLAFSSQHEKNQKWHESDFQKQGVKRAHASNYQVVQQARIHWRSALPRHSAGRGGHASFNSVDFSFNGVGRATEHASISWPVVGEIGDARTKAIADSNEDQNQEQYHSH